MPRICTCSLSSPWRDTLGNRPAELSRPTRRSWSDWGTTSDLLHIVKSFDFCIYWLLFVCSGGIWYIGFQILWWILMAIVESVSHRIWRCVSYFSSCFGFCSLRQFNVTPNDVYLRSVCMVMTIGVLLVIYIYILVWIRNIYIYILLWIKRSFLKFLVLFFLSSSVVVKWRIHHRIDFHLIVNLQ